MPVSLFNKVAGLRPASEKETLRRRPFRQIGSLYFGASLKRITNSAK